MAAEPINLLLQLLNSLHLVIGVTLLVQFVRDQVRQLILVVVSECKYLLEVCPLIVVNDVLVLEGHDRLTDLRDVLIENLSLQDREEFGEVVHDSLPVALSD